jgi:para-aminobenzoate synthetase
MPPRSRGSYGSCMVSLPVARRLVLWLIALANVEGWSSSNPIAQRGVSNPRNLHTPRREKNDVVIGVDSTQGGDWVPQSSSSRCNLRLLFIDHYDSFTYNLVDIFAQICQRAPLVVAADAATSWKELTAMTSSSDSASGSGASSFDGIVLGPGPGFPSDYPLSLDVIRNANVPILGVCLGHQMLGQEHGATVTLAPTEIHGQVWTVHLHRSSSSSSSSSLLDGLPATIPATRYHSLQVTWDRHDSGVPLVETARSDDGVCMGLQHSFLPHYGVQFHPESIGTEPYGKLVLENFCQICQRDQQSAVESISTDAPRTRTADLHDEFVPSDGSAFSQASSNEDLPSSSRHRSSETVGTARDDFEVLIRKVRFPSVNRPNPDSVMQALLSQETYSFWLDSSNHQQSPNVNNRVSILGTTSAAETGGRRIEYYGEEYPQQERGVFVYPNTRNDDESSPVERHDTDILTYLGTQIPQNLTTTTLIDDVADEPMMARDVNRDSLLSLPFSFRGGYVGYLGYEVRFDAARFLQEAELGSKQRHSSPRSDRTDSRQSSPQIPTAAFLWADRSFVYDHLSQEWYVVAVSSRAMPEQRAAALSWLKSSAQRIQELGSLHERTSAIPGKRLTVPVAFVPNRSRNTYNRNFERCLELIRQGESYELCLTNQLEATVGSAGSLSPLSLYRILRRRNPAPFAAFLNWNSERDSAARVDDTGVRSGSVAIACSSPERFLSVQPKATLGSSSVLEVEAKPIKGTCARVQPANGRSRTLDEEEEDARRARELQNSIKNRAENLMIVDLLRNDLSRVCEVGSVRVAKLMDIESFATVHQMVSTIRGNLDPSRASSIDVLKACFPGGSMTGAPKQRTMDLLDDLEEGVSRGLYSGCLGYISLDGSMDMNIVIRSAVLTRENEGDAWHVSIGAGGAITALSESNDEYSEMMLKASAVMSAVCEWANSLQTEDRATYRLAMNTTSTFAAAHNLTNAFNR